MRRKIGGKNSEDENEERVHPSLGKPEKAGGSRVRLLWKIISKVVFPLLGYVIAIVTNLPQIEESYFFQPKFMLVVEDSFLEKVGQVAVYDRTVDTIVPVLMAPVKDAKEWVRLKPGSYHLVISVDNREVYGTDFLVRKGEARPILIPIRDAGNIGVFVENFTPNPRPAEKLDLAITSSGNGYVWIFDYADDGQYLLIYPDIGLNEYHNDIYAQKPFTFPDADHMVLRAGDTPREEKLLVVVTSSKKVALAREIASRMEQVVLRKATAGKATEENWGMLEVSYQVRR